MNEFSITETAYTGFRIVRERPWALAYWALLNLIVDPPVNQAAAPMFAALQTAMTGAGKSPDQLMAALKPAWPMLLGAFAVSLVINATVSAAMNRAVLRPQEDRFGYLRLGMDELRQLGLALAMAGLSFALVVAVTAVVVGLSALAGGDANAAQAIAMLILIGVGITLGVRLSMASALTFDSQKIDLFHAWQLTRGRFWRLAGTYLLALAMTSCVIILTGLVARAGVALASGGVDAIAQVADPNVASWHALFTPARLIFFLLSAISTALTWPVFMTPPAAAYASLVQRSRYV